MARIKNKDKYIIDTKVTDDDYLIGSDAETSGETKNFLVKDLKEFIIKDVEGTGGNGDTSTDYDNQDDGIDDGNGTYTWLKYSQYPNGYVVDGGVETDTVSMMEAPLMNEKDIYIGLAYEKPTRVESDDPKDYFWQKFATWTYDEETDTWYYVYETILDENGLATWIKYADTADPTKSGVENGISDNPFGKAWIGFSYKNDPEAVESLIMSDYRWSKILGNDGKDGIPIAGTDKFLWIKYSNDLNGRLGGTDDGESTMVDESFGMAYIGIALGTIFKESDNPDVYNWASTEEGEIYDETTGTYTWIRYAEEIGETLSIIPTENSRFLGFAIDQTMSWKEDILLDDPLSIKWSTYQWTDTWADKNGSVVNNITLNYTSTHTWLKFSKWENGMNPNLEGGGVAFSDMTDTVEADTLYEGWGFDKEKLEDKDPNSDKASEYDWYELGAPILRDGFFTWRKYSKYYNGFNPEGDGTFPDMHDDATPEDKFVGVSHYHLEDQTADPIPEDSLNPKEYQWFGITEPQTDKEFNWTWLKYAELKEGEDVDCVKPSCIDADTMTTEVGADDTKKGISFNHRKPSYADTENSNKPENYVWGCIICDIQLADGRWVWDKFSDSKFGRTGEAPNVGDISMQQDPRDGEGNALKYMGLVIKDISEAADEEEFGDAATSLIPETYYWGTPDEHKELPFDKIWIKFANDDKGKDISNNPENRSYMGIGYFKPNSNESLVASDYVWNPIGDIQWYEDLNFVTKATWVKWAENPSTDEVLKDIPDDSTQYMGLAFTKDEEETRLNGESTDYNDYNWYRFEYGNPDNIHTDQNNRVKIINIPATELTGGVMTLETLTNWVNNNGLSVAQDENVLFTIDGEEEEEEVIIVDPKILDPDILLTLTTSAVTKNTVQLDWNANGDEAVVRFEVVYESVATGRLPHIQVGAVTSYSLGGLIPNTSYTVWILGYDSYGNVKTSNIEDFQTLVDFTTGIPTIWSTGQTTTTISLEWFLDSSFNAVRYVITETEQGLGVYDETGLTKTIQNLTANTSYTFNVVGYDSNSTPSAQSTDLTISTLEPDAVLTTPTINLVESTIDSLSISIGSEPTEIDYVSKYLIIFGQNGLTPEPQKEYTKEDLVHLFSNLNEQTSYDFSVQLLALPNSSYTNSVFSPIYTFRTKEDKRLKISSLDETGFTFSGGGIDYETVTFRVTLEALTTSTFEDIFSLEFGTLQPNNIISKNYTDYTVNLDGGGYFVETIIDWYVTYGDTAKLTIQLLSTTSPKGIDINNAISSIELIGVNGGVILGESY